MASKTHNRILTKADLAAASRLKEAWKAIPPSERPTQQSIADSWDGDGEGNQSLIHQYMNGKIALNYRAVLAFSRALGIPPESIRNDLPEQKALQPGKDSGWAEIQAYAQAVGLGAGPEADEYAEAYRLKFRALSLAGQKLRPQNLAVMYGAGDSMLPRIHSGDAILFDTSDTKPRDGKLFVIIIDGAMNKEYQVKRCEILDDMVFFKADNPSGDHNWIKPRKMDSEKHPIEIVGRVRWIGSWEY